MNPSETSPPFVLFYSKFCRHSRECLEALRTHPLQKDILFLCVDDKKDRLPPGVRSVPTIFDRRTKQYHVGESVGHFLQVAGSAAQARAKATTAAAASAAAAPPAPVPGGTDDGSGIAAWHASEMNAFADQYSYIDSTAPTPGAFSYLTAQGGYGEAPVQQQAGGYMVPSHGMARMGSVPESTSSRDKAANKDLESAYEAMLAARKDAGYIARV